ncbi:MULTISPECIES: hypothetical protein [Rhizobium]|uniref:hypothetical protein n=1 Tax=Rhizobium TaxID=379 RepID=UPI00142D9517|nr:MULTISPECIES: hypothetical protein [Rhizobium]
MSKNDTPPRLTSPTLPDRLRKDGWWLTEVPIEARLGNTLIMIENRHPQEEQQWTQPTS